MEESTTTPIQQNPILPDSVLEELEKVGQMEQSIVFLKVRQGVIEDSVHELKEAVIDKGDNIVSEESKEKESKDLVKTDDLKPYLTTVEKKRYENIGVEFVKGAEKVFDELQKAQDLKNRMNTRTLEAAKIKIDKKQKEEKRKKSGFGSLFLKLGIAIAAVVAVLEVFKNKIDEIIPNFSSKYDSVMNPIKDIGNKVLNALSDFLSNTIGKYIKETFVGGESSVKSLLTKFLTHSLPNVIYQSGLELLKAFGANVNTSKLQIDQGLQRRVDSSLKSGKENTEKLNGANDIKTDATKNASEKPNTEVISIFGKDFVDQFSKVMGAQTPNDYIANGYDSALVTALTQQWEERGEKRQINLDNGVQQDELLKIHKSLGISENFNDWKNRKEVQEFFGLTQDENINSQAVKNLQQGVANFKDKLLKLQNESTSTVVDSDVSKKVELSIEPVSLAQDAFVLEINKVYEIFKQGVFGADFGNTLLNSAKEVTQKLYEQFLQPIFDIVKNLLPISQPSYSEEKNAETIVIQGAQTPSQGSQISPININTRGTAPVVVIDFSLSPTVVHSATELAKVKDSLLSQVTATNEKLQELSNIVLLPKDSENDEQGVLNQIQETVKSQGITLIKHANDIKTIADYLEANDRDGSGEAPIDDFVLQTS